MTIPKEQLERWKTLKERGDIRKLVKLTKLSRSSIYNLFEDGECASDVAAKITAFYNNREKVRDYAEKLMEGGD